MARYGMLGHVKFTFQETFGLVATTSSQVFPILEESLSKKIDRSSLRNMIGGFSKTKTIGTKRVVDGSISILGYPTALAYGLKSVLKNTSVFSSEFRHEFQIADKDYSAYVATDMLTVEVNRDEGSNSQYYQDMNGSSFVINIVTGELVSFDLELLGTGQQEDTKTTAVYLDEKPFKWDQCSIQLDGAAELDFESLSISVNNNLEARNTLVNTYSAQKIKRTEEVSIAINASLIVQSNSYWQAFTNQNEHSFGLDMVNADGNKIGFSIPNMQLTNYDSNISGPGVIQATFTAEAFYSPTSLAMLVTIVNSEPLFNSPFILDDDYYGLLDQDYNFLE